jgi:tRNA A37 threonylcarbamoyladenosine dehydratase
MSTLSDPYRQRFGGIARLYGEPALEQLAAAHFVVIGIGGVGTWVAEALARSGVGTLTLIDLDDICITNTNRQVHTLQSVIGKPKTAVMAARLRDINPEVVVHEVEDFIDPDNTADLLDPACHQLVIDAADTANAKSSVIAFCKRNKIPVVTVGSAGGKRDPRQIVSADLTRTNNDPLLAKVRNQLRRLHNFSRNTKRRFSVEAIYSEEQMVYPAADGGTCQSKNFQGGVKLDCSGGFGAASMVTATFGMVAASRAIERYLQRAK